MILIQPSGSKPLVPPLGEWTFIDHGSKGYPGEEMTVQRLWRLRLKVDRPRLELLEKHPWRLNRALRKPNLNPNMFFFLYGAHAFRASMPRILKEWFGARDGECQLNISLRWGASEYPRSIGKFTSMWLYLHFFTFPPKHVRMIHFLTFIMFRY